MAERFEIKVLRLESGRFILNLTVDGHTVILATTDAEPEAVADEDGAGEHPGAPRGVAS